MRKLMNYYLKLNQTECIINGCVQDTEQIK